MKLRIGNSIVNTQKAVAAWKEEVDWNGKNFISRPTGTQWHHETLYKSKKGNYYIVTTSQWQGVLPTARFVTNEEAARWLLINEHSLPDDLEQYADKVEE